MCWERRAVIDSWETEIDIDITLWCIIQPTFLIPPLLNLSGHAGTILHIHQLIFWLGALADSLPQTHTFFPQKKLHEGFFKAQSLVGFTIQRPSCKTFFQRMLGQGVMEGDCGIRWLSPLQWERPLCSVRDSGKLSLWGRYLFCCFIACCQIQV